MRVTNAWTGDRGAHVYFIDSSTSGSRKFRVRDAEWTGFVQCDSKYASKLARRGKVVSVANEGDFYRVVFADRRARYDLRDEIADELRRDAVREFDVSPHRRFLADTKSLEIEHDLRVLLLDCEVDDRHSFDAQKAGYAPVLMISARDWKTGEIVFSRCLGVEDDGLERIMHLDFWRAIRSYDVLCAWNGGLQSCDPETGYDFPVLDARFSTLGLNMRRDVFSGSKFVGDLRKRWTRLDQLEVDVKARAASDSGDTKSSNKLDDVVYARCGIRKIEMPTKGQRHQFFKCWNDHRDVFVEYGDHDTHLQRENERATGFVEGLITAMRICYCPPTTENLGAVQQADGIVLRDSLRTGFRWPTRWRSDKKDHKWKGAYVKHPTQVGIVDDVVVPDFSGWYPSLLISGHMSPENKELDVDGPNAARLPGREGAFRRDQPGIFPEIARRLIDARRVYQRAAKKEEAGSAEHRKLVALATAQKIVVNSISFGVLGTPYSRYCDQQTFEGITTTGAYALQYLEGYVQQEPWNAEVLAGDSDSLFLHKIKFEDAARLCEHLNTMWPSFFGEFGWVKESCCVELEAEDEYARIVLDGTWKIREKVFAASKKRYFARPKMYKGRPVQLGTPHKIRGWAARRGDSKAIQRRMETQMFDLFLGAPNKPLPARSSLQPKQFVAWIDRWRTRVLAGDFEFSDVVRSQGLNKTLARYERGRTFNSAKCQITTCGHDMKTTKSASSSRCLKCNEPRARKDVQAHVQIAREMARRGHTPAVGDKIAWVYAMADDGSTRFPARVEDIGDTKWVDRASIWESAYKPIREQLQAVFPDHKWPPISEKRIRSRQHDELVGVQSSMFGAVKKSPREVTIEMVVTDAAVVTAFGSLVDRFVGSDILTFEFRHTFECDESNDPEIVRWVTEETFDARVAVSVDPRLRQVGAARYAFALR